jgi:hypothetical protein
MELHEESGQRSNANFENKDDIVQWRAGILIYQID